MSRSRDSLRPSTSIAPASAWRMMATLSGRLGRTIRNSGSMLVLVGKSAPELIGGDIMAVDSEAAKALGRAVPATWPGQTSFTVPCTRPVAAWSLPSRLLCSPANAGDLRFLRGHLRRLRLRRTGRLQALWAASLVVALPFGRARDDHRGGLGDGAAARGRRRRHDRDRRPGSRVHGIPSEARNTPSRRR